MQTWVSMGPRIGLNCAKHKNSYKSGFATHVSTNHLLLSDFHSDATARNQSVLQQDITDNSVVSYQHVFRGEVAWPVKHHVKLGRLGYADRCARLALRSRCRDRRLRDTREERGPGRHCGHVADGMCGGAGQLRSVDEILRCDLDEVELLSRTGELQRNKK